MIEFVIKNNPDTKNTDIWPWKVYAYFPGDHKLEKTLGKKFPIAGFMTEKDAITFVKKERLKNKRKDKEE